jgi:DegV family protein with EDD domain
MIRIVTESMSDFTQEEAKAADLIVMPLPIRFGMEEYWDDGVSLTQDDFYARLRVAKELPKTSQVPVEHYRKCFNRLLENPEDEVLVITGSSKLSGCYQSACIAREACHDPARVTVLDSLNATCAEYMLVDQALRYRREGVSDMPTMLAKLRDVMAHYKIIGMAADLKYLVMGGRLSPLVGKLGNRLSIKPTLKIEDGIVSKAGMVHGMAKGRAWYIEQLKECPPDPDVPVISAARTARRRLRSSSRRLKRRISAFRTSAASKSGV